MQDTCSEEGHKEGNVLQWFTNKFWKFSDYTCHREKAARSAADISATMLLDESLILKLAYYQCYLQSKNNFIDKKQY